MLTYVQCDPEQILLYLGFKFKLPVGKHNNKQHTGLHIKVRFLFFFLFF